MPIRQILTIRPINLKIVFYRGAGTYNVYNLHNQTSRSFTSFNRLVNYHSPNTSYIYGSTSRVIDVRLSCQAENNGSRYRDNIITNNTTIWVKKSRATYNGGELYLTLNGTPVSREHVNEIESTTELAAVYYFPIALNRRISSIMQANCSPENSQFVEEFVNQLSQVNTYSSTPHEETTQQEEINTNLIYNYHRGPRETIFHKHQEDNDNEKRFFGIELEVDGSRDNNASREKKNKLATRLNTLLNDNVYNALVKFEEDGSLGQYGVEIITQPMTMKYILNNKEKFAEAMRIIEGLDYCSHDSQRCGMHIHVSKDALNDDVIDNLYLMFENFRNELVAFSRRTQDGMRWCRFMSDNDYHPTEMSEEYIKQNKPTRNDHGSAINSGQINTVEFRIFRGTTKMRTFIANIQLIDNMIDIASKENIEGITWEQIINLKPEYEELIKYNEIRAIVSKHQLSKNISKLEITQRPVILVRPFQLNLEGDN